MCASHQFEFNSEYIFSQQPNWLEKFRLVRVVCEDTVLWRCGHASLRWQAASAGKHRSGGNASICKRRVSFMTSPTPQEKSTHCIGQIT